MGEAVIATKGLTKNYGTFTAVKDLNLTIQKGEVFGLLGPNGAGKTTTILMLLGLTLLLQGESLAQIKPSLTAMVPMRDGTRLATDVYLPSGAGPWPVALARTPYGKSDLQHITLDYTFPVQRSRVSRLVTEGVALVVPPPPPSEPRRVGPPRGPQPPPAARMRVK